MSIDIELSSIDINQCDAQDSKEGISDGENGKSDRTGSTDSVKLLEFMGTHKCKPSTKVINNKSPPKNEDCFILSWMHHKIKSSSDLV